MTWKLFALLALLGSCATHQSPASNTEITPTVSTQTVTPGDGPVTGGDPLVLGPLPKDQVTQVVGQAMPAIQGCYEQLLTDAPSATGHAVIQFAIESRGGVGSATAKSVDAPLAPLVPCLIDTLRGLQFPTPAGGGTVKVSYPFQFTP